MGDFDVRRRTDLAHNLRGDSEARQTWTHQGTRGVTHKRTSPSSALSSRKCWTNMQSWSATSTMYVNYIRCRFLLSFTNSSIALRDPSRARRQPINRDPRLIAWPGAEDSYSVHVTESQRVFHRPAAGDQRRRRRIAAVMMFSLS